MADFSTAANWAQVSDSPNSPAGADGENPGPASALVHTTVFASGPAKTDRLAARYALQNESRRLLAPLGTTFDRLNACLRVLRPGASAAEVLYDPEHGAAHYGNLCVCGLAWVCPPCAAKITERRAEELRLGLNAHPELSQIMATMTFQHSRADDLKSLIGYLKGAGRRARSGRRWQELKGDLGLVGSLTGTEITWGKANGWHPHSHCLFLASRSIGQADERALREVLTDGFGRYLEREGRYLSPLYGVDVVSGDASVARYLCKVRWDLAAELTKSSVKQARADGGYSPFMLLDRSHHGADWAGRLFVEYATATRGMHLLDYSDGLRKLLALPEVTDEQLALEDREQAYVLLTIPGELWRAVVAHDARAEVLMVCRAGDPVAAWAFLERLAGL